MATSHQTLPPKSEKHLSEADFAGLKFVHPKNVMESKKSHQVPGLPVHIGEGARVTTSHIDFPVSSEKK